MHAFFAWLGLYPNEMRAFTTSLNNCDTDSPPSSKPSESSLVFMNFSFSSTMIRLAVLAPTPGTAVNATTSPAITRSFNLDGSIPDSIVNASLGPIPLIEINN